MTISSARTVVYCTRTGEVKSLPAVTISPFNPSLREKVSDAPFALVKSSGLSDARRSLYTAATAGSVPLAPGVLSPGLGIRPITMALCGAAGFQRMVLLAADAPRTRTRLSKPFARPSTMHAFFKGPPSTTLVVSPDATALMARTSASRMSPTEGAAITSGAGASGEALPSGAPSGAGAFSR